MQGASYSVDIVLCIDATASMTRLIDKVKANALSFHADLLRMMEEKSKRIDRLRVRVVAFRDFYVDGEMSLQESPFFLMPQQQEAFAEFINKLSASGGGDDPETSLEALALAIRSAWETESDKRRQIVVMWTDTTAHPLDRNRESKPPHYPTGMPRDFDELTDWWEGQSHMSMPAKRLIIYAPDSSPWNEMQAYWNNVLQYPSQAGQGLADVDYSMILDSIANSV